ncbi:protein spinster homolog 1-like [Styela clava]
MAPVPYNGNDVWVRREDSPTGSSSSQYFDPNVADSSSALISADQGKELNGHIQSDSESSEPPGLANIPKWRRYAGVGILFFINLLNYMDRYTIAGVLIQITDNFEINNAMAGLLQTVFIISYMLVAPLFGYLGDRYNRIIIMVVGMLMWSGFTLAASFISKPEHFPLFLLTRALVGIGEASYSTIAPTLIGDMFAGADRTRMLSVFFFATPVGSGLGYIVGSAVAKALGGWEWALRVTPGLGIVAVLLLIFVCPNPPRGACEAKAKDVDKNQNTYLNDLSYLTKNKSFIFVTLGFTFMAFVVGSLTLWGPTYFAYSQIAIGALEPCLEDDCDYAGISFIFGLITCIAGFGGVGIGAESARRWKLNGCAYADPIVCAIGLLLGAPLLYIGLHLATVNINAAWTLVFFADLTICFTWTLISDMTLYVCQPSRRSTANAVQLLVGHLFGDAGSPYLLGVIADSLLAAKPDTYMSRYLAYQRSMYITLFACVIGGGGFLFVSLFIVEDKKKVDDFLKGSDSSSSTKTSSANSNISIGMDDRIPKLQVNDNDLPNPASMNSKTELYLENEDADEQFLVGKDSEI